MFLPLLYKQFLTTAEFINHKLFEIECNAKVTFSVDNCRAVDPYKFMVVYDEDTIKIKENDYFLLDNVKYIIKDLGNQNRLNIYFDMLVERC